MPTELNIPHLGDIWIANIPLAADLTVSKARPVLVTTNNKRNRFCSTIKVIPFTTNLTRFEKNPLNLLIKKTKQNGLHADSVALTTAHRVLPRSCLLYKKGTLSEEDMLRIAVCQLIDEPMLIEAMAKGGYTLEQLRALAKSWKAAT